jgi:hypothetical protein
MNSNITNCLKYLDPEIKRNPEDFTNPIRNIKSYTNEHITKEFIRKMKYAPKAHEESYYDK